MCLEVGVSDSEFGPLGFARFLVFRMLSGSWLAYALQASGHT